MFAGGAAIGGPIHLGGAGNHRRTGSGGSETRREARTTKRLKFANK